ISPIANLLGMPLLGPIMIFGGFGAALGSIWLPLGAVLLWPAWAFTTLLDWLVTGSAGLPNAALPLDGMAPPAVGVYYAVLLGLTWSIRRSRLEEPSERPRSSKRLAWAAMAAGAAAVAAVAALSERPPAAVRTTLLAIPGQAALIQTPSGKTILVDGGESGPALLHELGQLLPPWQRNLDLVLITSPKTDRIGGLEDVFARYSVARVIEPDVGRATATFWRLQSNVQRLTAGPLDIGDAAVLRREAQGWRVEQGAGSVLVTDTGFEVRTLEGDWRILPMLRGAKPPADDELALAETGNVTVSFGPLD
ncbi:MAG: ComEC/Rec2 family competence protein, partial [Chloroflexota bacterium]